MPISTLISLIPETDVALRPTMGHHAHAAFLSIMRETNPKVAETLHASSAQKPFTVSPLIAEGKRRGDYLHIRAGTECKLRFTFLDDTLFTFFGQSFLTQVLPTIRLGEATFTVKQLVSHATDDQIWSGSATYPELIQTAHTDHQMSFRFYSPTAFRRLTARGEKTRNEAYIDMERCYQSWVNKWNAFAPIHLDKNEIRQFVRDYGQVTRVDAKSKRLNYGKHTVPGWVGTCAWVFYPEKSLDEDMLRVANCLAILLSIAGQDIRQLWEWGKREGYEREVGWKIGRMEKDGRMYGMVDGRLEGWMEDEWKNGRMEGWKNGRLEDWKRGRWKLGRVEGGKNGSRMAGKGRVKGGIICLKIIYHYHK